MATFVVRPREDEDPSYGIKSDPTKDYWEHLFAEDDGLYVHNTAPASTNIACKFKVSADTVGRTDIPSVSGITISKTRYIRVRGIDVDEENPQTWRVSLGTVTQYFVAADGYVTKSRVYDIDYLDDILTASMSFIIEVINGGQGYSYTDYEYDVIEYTPAPPDVYYQNINALDIGNLAEIEGNFDTRKYTRIVGSGYEVRLKSTQVEVTRQDNVANGSWLPGHISIELGNDVLEYSTTYEARLYAKVDVEGKGYGAWVEFTTRAAPAEVTTEAASSIGVDHAKGNGTAIGENITERGFEVKLAFSGTLYEAIHRRMAGFEGSFTHFGFDTWTGTLVKTATETGSFATGAFVGDLGRFPQASFVDKLFPHETYDYRAYAIIDGEAYYGDYVEFTTAHYAPGEELPDDVISPEVPIIEPLPPEEGGEIEEFEWPEFVFPPWEWPEFDIPPFEFDPSITFGRTFGAFLRGLDTRKDWKTLREKCIIYQENMNEFTLTINHNSLVLKNLVIDIITYIDGDVYPSDLELTESSQQLTPLYLEGISPDGFKDMINDFRLKDVCNVHTLNLNFQKILNSLNSLYESDYTKEPIYYNTLEYIDIQPTAKRMILQLEDMRKKSREITRLTIRNMKRIFTYA